MEKESQGWGSFFASIVKVIIIVIVISQLLVVFILLHSCKKEIDENKTKYYVDSKTKIEISELNNYIISKLRYKYNTKFEIVKFDIKNTVICLEGFIDSGCLRRKNVGEEYIFVLKDTNNVYFSAVYKDAYYIDYYNTGEKRHYDSYFSDNYHDMLEISKKSDVNELFESTKNYTKERINTIDMYFVPIIQTESNLEKIYSHYRFIIETIDPVVDENINNEIISFYDNKSDELSLYGYDIQIEIVYK